jgi:uncharacterized Zn finger protein (UPF0148 family)
MDYTKLIEHLLLLRSDGSFETVKKEMEEEARKAKETITESNKSQQNTQNKDDNDDEEDDDLLQPKDCGFLYTMLLYTLLSYMSEENRLHCESNEAFQWFRERTGRIEIVREIAKTGEKRLYTVLFPIPELCSYMREDTKLRFLWKCKR